MPQEYVLPKHQRDAFNCPHCKVYARQSWHYEVFLYSKKTGYLSQSPGYTAGADMSVADLGNCSFSKCDYCRNAALWQGKQLAFPLVPSAPPPHKDMPKEVNALYEEAARIAAFSPRAAAALLRLAIDQLTGILGETDRDLNKRIGGLVQKGLPATVQQALDSVRLIGNDAVHPGEIQFDDKPAMAETLFKLVNFVVERMIAAPKEVEEMYNSLPEPKRIAIIKRDTG